MKSFLALIACCLMVFSSIANDKYTLSDVMLKYNYQLTAHPQAHESEFREEVTKNYEQEAKGVISKMSSEEIKAELDKLINKIPSEEERISIIEKLKTLNQEQIIRLLADESFLDEVFNGESSNFSHLFNIRSQYIYGAIVITAITYLIFKYYEIDSDYEHFYSFKNSYDFDFIDGTCKPVSEMYNYEKEWLMRDALNKCLIGATHPSTCRFTRFQRANPPSHLSGSCYVQAVYSADKVL